MGHQLRNGYWVKAKIVGPEPEYLLAMMQGFAILTERKKLWQMQALTEAHFNVQRCHDKGLAQAGIDSAFHGLLISAGLVKGRRISGYYSIKDDINNAGGTSSAGGFLIIVWCDLT